MIKIQHKSGGRPAKETDGQAEKKVVSTKLTELQYYAIKKRAGEAGLRISGMSGRLLFRQRSYPG